MRKLFQNYVFVGVVAGIPALGVIFGASIGLPVLLSPAFALVLWIVAVAAAAQRHRGAKCTRAPDAVRSKRRTRNV